MSDLTYISEGYYRNENNEYMSIWTFKIKNGIKPNDTEQNYEDAKNIPCADKYKKPFNASNKFKEGWMYNVNDLKEFYNI